MRAFRTQDGVHASLRKTGADARRELQGRGENSAFERYALLVIVRIAEQKTSIPPAGIYELGCADLSVLYNIPIMNGFFDDQPYPVAGLNLRAEINLPLKDRSEFCSEILPFWK